MNSSNITGIGECQLIFLINYENVIYLLLFLQNISPDIRTVMNAISTYSEKACLHYI